MLLTRRPVRAGALALAGGALLAAPEPAAAHAVGSGGAGISWEAAAPLAVVGALAAAYARGLPRAGPRGRGGALRHAAFGLGLLAIAAAVAGPVEAAAAESLSAHMGQHLLLIAVGAPLLALARPGGTLVAALPGRPRRVAGRALGRAARTLGRPGLLVAAGAGAAGVMVLWHVPGPYEAALVREWVHQLEHLTMAGSALVAWWGIVAAGRGGPGRAAAGIGCAGVALAGGGALGLAMMFSPRPWYADPHGVPFGLADQQVAGAMMWGPGGAVYAIAAGVLAARLLRARRPAAGRPLPG